MSRKTGTSFLRLTRNEASLIRPGLLRLVIAHRYWRNRGTSMSSPARFISIPGRRDEGEFSPRCQSTAFHVTVAATMSFYAQSRRLYLNAFELAACILGVRVTEMVARHGHLEPRPPKYKVRCRRLLKKLERLRKRAKCNYIHGQEAFAEASHRWQQYLRFVRALFTFCTCNRTLSSDPAGRTQRKLIEDEWMKYFREELPARGLDIPPELELRKLVRRALRVGRRFICQCGRPVSHEHHDLLKERRVNCGVRRCRKS